MLLEEILGRLREEVGAVRVEVMPDDLCEKIVAEEATVEAAMGNMPVINTGLDECMGRDVRICVFENDEFWHPAIRTMRMVGEDGQEVGHDLTPDEIPEFMKRSDVMFISDDFVMYPEVEIAGTPSMEMLAVEYVCRDGWIPREQKPIIWYPSSTSDEIIRRYFGQPDDGTATGMLALNL